MRRLILKIHLVIGLIVGAFMVLLGITGSIMAFEPELDELLHRDLSYVNAIGRVFSLADIAAAVSRSYGDEPIIAFLPATSPHVPVQVITSRGIVAVNQYTGAVLGVRSRGQTLLGFVRALHVRLASGDIGKAILRWSAVAMLFSLISGLYLWWPGKRTRIRGPWWSKGFWYDLHNAIGIFSLVPFLVLAGTGTVLGFEDGVAFLLDKIANPPALEAHPQAGRLQAKAHGLQLTPDQAVEIACALVPGALPYRVQMPRYGGRYQVSLLNPGNRVLGQRNSVSIDPWSGEVLSASLETDLSVREKVLAWNEAIHTGTALGMTSRIIVAAASILLPVQAVSGLLIWLRRRKLIELSESE